jgi:hypothetical protein
MSKGLIYKEENCCTCPDLLDRLHDELEQLNFICRANVPIKKGTARIGFGISESKKNIICESLIAIIKEIKKGKGW